MSETETTTTDLHNDIELSESRKPERKGEEGELSQFTGLKVEREGEKQRDNNKNCEIKFSTLNLKLVKTESDF